MEAVSVLFRIGESASIEVVRGDTDPAVTVDAEGQLHAESEVITYAGEDLDGDLRLWLS